MDQFNLMRWDFALYLYKGCVWDLQMKVLSAKPWLEIHSPFHMWQHYFGKKWEPQYHFLRIGYDFYQYLFPNFFCHVNEKELIKSSRPEVFCKKCVLRNFTKFTEKHLSQSLLKRLWHSCFLLNFVKFLRTLFYIEHLWWLLLTYEKHFVCFITKIFVLEAMQGVVSSAYVATVTPSHK